MDPEAAIGYTWKLETVINKLKDENIIGTYASMDIDDAYGEGNSIFNDEGELLIDKNNPGVQALLKRLNK